MRLNYIDQPINAVSGNTQTL